MDFRCPSALHGRITDKGLVEVSCKSRWCGKEAGNVILHRFQPETGELVETLEFKAPPRNPNTTKG
jgi:hypothetical protein